MYSINKNVFLTFCIFNLLHLLIASNIKINNQTNIAYLEENETNQTEQTDSYNYSYNLSDNLSDNLKSASSRQLTIAQAITVGPIIGKATSTTVRILVEFKITGDVTMTLTEDGTTNVFSKSYAVIANTPIVFSFSNLLSYKKYLVSTTANTVELSTVSGYQSSFRTLKGDFATMNDFNVIFLSCNDVRYSEQLQPTVLGNAQLWGNLARKAKNGEIDFIFHIGDQIYADHDIWNGNTDNVYYKVKTLLASVSYTAFSGYTETIRELLRAEYRRSWTYKTTAETLSLVPNLMIFDDHEFMNNFAFNSSVFDTTSIDYFYVKQARYVYYQYQRQLREDIDFVNFENTKDEYYIEIMNEIGFFVMDYRGPKVWHKSILDNSSVDQLGYTQYQSVVEAFSKNGTFKDVKAAVLVSTLPLLFVSTAMAQVVGIVMEDMKENWAYAYEDELITLLDIVRTWKDEKVGRQLLFVGGDVHLAGYTEVFYKKQPLGRQLVSTGINQVKLASCEILAIKAGIYLNDALSGNEYTYVHHDWVGQKNYGTVKFQRSILRSNETDITMFLTVSDSVKSITDLITVNNRVFTHNASMIKFSLVSMMLILLYFV